MDNFETATLEAPERAPLIAPNNRAQGEYWKDISGVESDIAKNQLQLQNPDISQEERTEKLKETRQLLCEKIRLQRPAVLLNPVLNKNASLRELATTIFGEEFEKDRKGFIDSLSPETLLSLEAVGPGTLAKLYAFRQNIAENGALVIESVNLATLTPGENVMIDFGKNEAARMAIPNWRIIPDNAGVNIL